MRTKFNLDAEMNKILLSNAYQQHSKPLSKKASADELKYKEILGCLKDLHDVCQSLEDSDKDIHKKCLKSIKELVLCCKPSEEIQKWAEKHGYLEETEEKEDKKDKEDSSEESPEDDNKSDDSFEFEVSLS